MRRERLFLCAALVVVATCGDGTTPIGPVVQPGPLPQFAISDAMHGGNPHFFWLPPLVRQASGYNGPFDGTQAPLVRICDLADCANQVIAEFTMTTGPGSETVRMVPVDEHYIVNWHTKDFPVGPGPTYRIRVLVGGTELGLADIQLVATGKVVR